MTQNIRRPDLLGVTEVGELTAKIQQSLEDIIAALEQPENAIRFDVKTMRWDEDGHAKPVLTSVQNPTVIVARATVHQKTAEVVATGSVSFSPTGKDEVSGDMGIDVTDISGLTTGTRYEVTLFIVGEV